MTEEVKILDESQDDTASASSNGTSSAANAAKRRYGSKKGVDDAKPLVVTKDNKVRHSQACDRCRLKKIKCDGLKPTCSQCSKVSYRCSTSDRLTRRGFPRGYTEMLEKEVIRLQRLASGKTSAGVGAAAAAPDDRLVGQTGGNTEAGPQFPFINDTFHYHSNYRHRESFLGHCTWSTLLNRDLDLGQDKDENWLNETHVAMMVNSFQLDHKNSFLPKFLIVKYKNDIKKTRKLVSRSISHFNKFQNSLIPLLQPFDSWKEAFNEIVNSSFSQVPNSVDLLALIYIVQLYWSCFDEFKIFQLTKIICSSKKTNLKQLQLLLVGSFYFMGGLISTKQSTNIVWSTELLHQSFAKVLDLGLYINSNRLVSTDRHVRGDGNESQPDQESRLISFWSFQFLDSLWSLFQGTPKLNFLIDEFHPQSINSLNNSADNSFLKPFTLLSDLIVNSLDGCNLLHSLSNNNHGRSQLIYATESFRKILKKLKLYHHLQDHENEIDDKFLSNSICLTKPDVVEIQLTLFYLIISFITSNAPHRDGDANIDANIDMEDVAYEILSLYYLLMIDESHLGQPSQLGILHILPCNNEDIILACIKKLNNWIVPSQGLNQSDNQMNWKFKKYQMFLTQWGAFFYYDDSSNLIWQQCIDHYNISLKQKHGSPKFNNRNNIQYLNKVEEFNSLDDLNKRSNLLRSNSNAVMDINQFDMFSHSNSMKHIFNGDLPTENNIIDISAFKSQIIIPHEEVDDDGYAEDDDDDDDEDDDDDDDDDDDICDDNGIVKPLEIPFRAKRTASLFQNKHNLPPSYHHGRKSQILDQNSGPAATPQGKRRTLDHIILDSKSFVSHDVQPSKRMRQNDNNRRKPFNAFDNSYSLIPATKKSVTTSGSSSSAINADGVLLPPPPPPNNDPLMLNKDSVNSFNGETSKNTSQIVETPRAFVDMMLLRSPSQQRSILKRQSSKPQLTNSNDFFELQ